MSFLQTTLAVFLNNKIMTILSLFTFVFFVCTVALAVSNGKLNSELERYKKLTNISDPNSLSSTEIITKATTKSLTTTTMDPEIPNEFRLPLGLVKEIEYDLTLRPNLEHGTFSGEIIILFKLSEKSSFVKINSKGLKIDNVDINHNTDVKIGEERNEIIKLEIPRLVQELEPEKLHTLTIKFSGDMKNRIVGLYSSSYIGEDDKPRYIATSKFEPTYARQAFPCFDEPNYKARYTVHIEKPKGNNYIALSNMDVKNITDVDNNTEIVNFNPSVPMSTYLTCFIVCDFKFSETKLIPSIGEPIALRVYATPAQVQKTKFSLDVAENCTLYYVDYFKIEYPLPKLDLIAIPDFVSGAMEHWGLVTFRETALLFDEKTSNSDNKQRVATVVAHELAHMWFGNLVTLDWWNDLWLNEGFATYLQFKACDHFLKDWGLLDQFLFDKVFPVMDFDATLASHPIVQTVSTPDQITEIFDAISYSKGAAVLRMLENAIGEEKFASGITKYLNQHKYGNAITINLWDQLQTTDPGFNVKDVMDTWTIQMGYPVVNVEEKNDEFILTQKRFLTDPDTINDSEISIFDYKYSIPITYSSDIASKIDTKSWFYWTDNSVSIAKPANATWVKINDKGSGFYRVNYSPKYWTDVLAKNVQNMDVSNRASLLDDIFSLAKAGEQKYNVALDFANVLSDEMDYVPWSVGIQRLTELKIFLKPLPNTYLRYQNFTHNLIKKVYNDLSWDEKPDETHQNNLLRGKVLNFGCSFGMTECLTKTKDSFNAWLNKDEAIPSNLKTIVFIYGMEDISSNDWHKFLTEKYIPEIDAQEKMKLLVGLTSTNRMDLLNELLMLAEDPNIVRSQDYFTCLEYISRNFAGTGLVWDYVRTNWLKLVDRFTLNNRYLGNLIPAITKTFSTTLKLEEMEAFFAKYPDAGAGQFARKNALETVKNNIKWINKYQNEVKEWLDDYQCDCI